MLQHLIFFRELFQPIRLHIKRTIGTLILQSIIKSRLRKWHSIKQNLICYDDIFFALGTFHIFQDLVIFLFFSLILNFWLLLILLANYLWFLNLCLMVAVVNVLVCEIFAGIMKR